MDQLASRAGLLRGFCNETVLCIGNLFCHNSHIHGGSVCVCPDGYVPNPAEENSCTEKVIVNFEYGPDPTMIGVVIGLALMSVTLCIVMRLFAKARFTENRTIFNTANPRLMNVSLKTTSGSGRGGADKSSSTGGTASASERERFTVSDGQQTQTNAESGLLQDPTSPV